MLLQWRSLIPPPFSPFFFQTYIIRVSPRPPSTDQGRHKFWGGREARIVLQTDLLW